MIAKTIVTLQTNVARSPLRTVRIGTGLAPWMLSDARTTICTTVLMAAATKVIVVAHHAKISMTVRQTQRRETMGTWFGEAPT